MKRKTLKFVEKNYDKNLFFMFMALVSLVFLLSGFYKSDDVSYYFFIANLIIYFLLFLTTEPKERIVKKEVIE
ncbi:MAG: hypothetical protein QW228_06050 [Candidatus Aenigmatarchaeota archaeon]